MSDTLTLGQLETIAICLDHGRRPHIKDCRKLLEMARAYVAMRNQSEALYGDGATDSQGESHD